MSSSGNQLVTITRDYYDSVDADNFYFHVWGGEHIHIGLYEDGADDVARASDRTVEQMAQRLALGPKARVLDLGAGYGGAARYLARTFGCHVTALNLSPRENERNRGMCAAAGLAALVDVVEGSYEDIPAADESFDAVWSQDALLHSAQKERIVAEAARVLVPGGDFIFTDPMESGRGSRAELQPVLDRIHLAQMGSFEGYAQLAADAGLETIELADLTEHLTRHYAEIRNELLARRENLAGIVSPAFVDRMAAGLAHWVTAGERGTLAWGILHFRKPRRRQPAAGA